MLVSAKVGVCLRVTKSHIHLNDVCHIYVCFIIRVCLVTSIVTIAVSAHQPFGQGAFETSPWVFRAGGPSSWNDTSLLHVFYESGNSRLCCQGSYNGCQTWLEAPPTGSTLLLKLSTMMHEFHLACVQYQMDPESGLFRHRKYHADKNRIWLSAMQFTSGVPSFSSSPALAAPTFSESLAEAEKMLALAKSLKVTCCLSRLM